MLSKQKHKYQKHGYGKAYRCYTEEIVRACLKEEIKVRVEIVQPGVCSCLRDVLTESYREWKACHIRGDVAKYHSYRDEQEVKDGEFLFEPVSNQDKWQEEHRLKLEGQGYAVEKHHNGISISEIQPKGYEYKGGIYTVTLSPIGAVYDHVGE